MGLGETSSSLTEEQLIMNNPHLKKLLNNMLDERIQNARTNGESSHSELLTGKESHKEPNRGNVVKIMKSPSDTMIYVPALKRRAINKDRMETDNFGNLQADLDSVANKNTNSIAENSGRRIESDAAAMLNISNFVDQLCLEHEEKEEDNSGGRPRSSVVAPGLSEVQKRMENAIVESEKF